MSRAPIFEFPAPIPWSVPCGCSLHGDHLGCRKRCRDIGCAHPKGVSVVCRDEGLVMKLAGQSLPKGWKKRLK